MMKLTPSDETAYLLDWITNRPKKNQNCLIVITGATGSGKTYSSITLAEVVSEKLGVDFSIKNVVFKPSEFMARINSGELKRGSCLIFDEAGVGYSAREWWTISNKMINYLMQTFRHRNYIVIFTTPDLGFIDKSARKLVHIHMETQSIDRFHSLVITRPFIAQSNQRTGKIYWKYLRVPVKGKLVPPKVERACFGLPSKRLRTQYEAKKLAYTDELNAEIERTLKGGGSKPLTEREKRYKGYVKIGLTAKQIAFREKVELSTVYQTFTKVRNKGYTLGE